MEEFCDGRWRIGSTSACQHCLPSISSLAWGIDAFENLSLEGCQTCSLVNKKTKHRRDTLRTERGTLKR